MLYGQKFDIHFQNCLILRLRTHNVSQAGYGSVFINRGERKPLPRICGVLLLLFLLLLLPAIECLQRGTD
jgi:preprotein translocase subunit SecG